MGIFSDFIAGFAGLFFGLLSGINNLPLEIIVFVFWAFLFTVLLIIYKLLWRS